MRIGRSGLSEDNICLLPLGNEPGERMGGKMRGSGECGEEVLRRGGVKKENRSTWGAKEERKNVDLSGRDSATQINYHS